MLARPEEDMRIHQVAFLFALAASLLAAACESRLAVQCAQPSDCNSHAGGACTAASTGNMWCSYPDPVCPSGMRYSDIDVGDGVGGQCVPQDAPKVDAGIDAPTTVTPGISCSALAHTCGKNKDDDCCTSLPVPGGNYSRSYDVATDGSFGDNTATATVSDFRLDKYEITVGRFRAFVASGGGTQAKPPAAGDGRHLKIANSGWDSSWNTNLVADTNALRTAINCGRSQTWTDDPGNNDNKPMNCITWWEAMAFCAWDGGYLPTEAEWNYAATGGSQQRAYPWSVPASDTTIDATRAVTGGAPAIVGSVPAGDGRWGHSDLAGNVWEWTLDWNSRYGPCNDCAILAPDLSLGSPPYRTNRGGGMFSPPSGMRTGNRGASVPTTRIDFTGARCARSP